MMSFDVPSMKSPARILRPVVWFAAASMVTTILHELTHACTAYALGVRSTLYSYFVDLDLTQAQTATTERVLIGVSGPLVCLAFGIVAWLAFRRARGSAAELPLLYLSVFGAGTFFGNLMSTPFVGDFSAAAVVLRLPMNVRYAIGLIGALSAAAVHVWAGRELLRWVPAPVDRVVGTLGMIVLPVVLGTAGVIIVNLPMPPASVAARAAEASFWIFAVIGALGMRRRPPRDREPPGLRWADGAVTLLALVAVRVMVRGILFAP